MLLGVHRNGPGRSRNPFINHFLATVGLTIMGWLAM
jgi:hypothetical protein